MKRRMFLGSLAAYVLTPKEFLAARQTPPIPTVVPVTLTINFTESYMGEATLKWTEPQKQELVAAAKYFQDVWSSQNFCNHVVGIPTLHYQDSKMVTGPDLYGILTKTPAKVMNLSVNDRHKERARTNPSTSETLVHLSYLEDPTMTMGDFVNTLSHECTHYEATGASWDRGHSSSLRDYVSYGIGCLTQNLSAQGASCPYDPTRPPSAGKKPFNPKWPEHADD